MILRRRILIGLTAGLMSVAAVSGVVLASNVVGSGSPSHDDAVPRSENTTGITVPMSGEVVSGGQAGDENGDKAPLTSHHDELLDRVADILGVDRAELEDAFKQARTELMEEKVTDWLDKMVADGVITREQADELEAWLKERPEFLDDITLDHVMASGLKLFKHHREHRGTGPVIVLPRSIGQGVDMLLERLVESGVLTQAKADEIKAWLNDRPEVVDGLLDGAKDLGKKLPRFHFDFDHKKFKDGGAGGFWMRPFDGSGEEFRDLERFFEQMREHVPWLTPDGTPGPGFEGLFPDIFKDGMPGFHMKPFNGDPGDIDNLREILEGIQKKVPWLQIPELEPEDSGEGAEQPSGAASGA